MRQSMSAIWPREHHDRMHRLFPAVRLVTIPGAGHWVHADAPAELSAELIDFLG